MEVVGLCMVKDEEDIIGACLQHHLNQGLDKIYIYNNLSSDKTEEIIKTFDSRVILRQDNEFGYFQERKMNEWLADIRREREVTWIVPFDADEFWEATPNLKLYLKNNHAEAIQFPVFVVKPNGKVMNASKFGVVAFKNFEWAHIAAGNHFVNLSTEMANGKVFEYQYRNFEQYCRKLRNGKKVYDETNLPKDFGLHWRIGGDKTNEELLSDWEEYLSDAE